MHPKKLRRLSMVSVLVLITCLLPCMALENNLTMPEVPLNSAITVEDDSEQELSSQLQEVESRSGGWSSWSDWSPCSRSCDGGVSHQLRTCTTGSCRGDHIRYKICNMQVVALFALLAVANAGLIAPAARILQGPSSRTTIVGPDGSAISAVAPGGTIVSDVVPGVVAQTVPAVAAASVIAAPAVVARAAPLALAAPGVLASGVVASGLGRTVVAGPSGVIDTVGPLAGLGLVGSPLIGATIL